MLNHIATGKIKTTWWKKATLFAWVCLFCTRSENKWSDSCTSLQSHSSSLPLELSHPLRTDEFSSSWSAKWKILCNTFPSNLVTTSRCIPIGLSKRCIGILFCTLQLVILFTQSHCSHFVMCAAHLFTLKDVYPKTQPQNLHFKLFSG